MKPVLPARSVTVIAGGNHDGFDSRAKVTGSFSWTGTRRAHSVVTGAVVAPVERGLERVPAEARALHARRELAHAGERRELAEVRRRGVSHRAGQQVVHLIEQLERFADASCL